MIDGLVLFNVNTKNKNIWFFLKADVAIDPASAVFRAGAASKPLS